MEVVNIQNRKELDGFVSSISPNCSLQSWDWGEFQRKAGCQVARFAAKDRGVICAAATLIEKKLPFGRTYYYLPRGPIINEGSVHGDREYIFEFLIDAIEKYALKQKALFIRIEPDFLPNSHLKLIKTIDVQPSRTVMLELPKPEEALLKAMHQKTRYNIKLAIKKGVEVIEAKPQKFNTFWKLMSETGQRDKFRLHAKQYYQKMLRIGGTTKLAERHTSLSVKLFLANYQGQAVAASLVAFYGDTATYMHGCSSSKHRSIMAPYALQWHCIRQAKEKGCRYYDLFGVDEKKWPGVTRFKNGFGGNQFEYPGTYDAVVSPKYYKIYKLARKLRRTV
jgi:peptidoglycan pentaglycine glycine transferase (the first glycine)